VFGLRRIVAAVSLAVAILIASSPAIAAPSRHLIVVWLDGTTLADWSSPSLPHFKTLLEDGAIALLATRTAREIADLRWMRASAAVTFSAGSEGAGDPRTGKPIKETGVTPGLLGDVLVHGGYVTGLVELGSIDRSAALALAQTDGSLPPRAGQRLPIARGAGAATLVDVGGQPINKADEVLGQIQRGMSSHDLLVVVSGSPSVARQKQGIRLAAVAIEGPGFGRGLLTSGTTRRDGIISLTDLAPTIVDALGLPALSGIEGRAATVVPRAHAERRSTAGRSRGGHSPPP
jgi:hypothetical protein